MKQVSLEVNELVRVSFLQAQSSKTFSSRVEDLKNRRIAISWPTDEGVPVPFHQGESVYLSFIRPDALYGFEARVERIMRLPFPMLVVSATTEIQRTQRREYVRVKVMLPLRLIEMCHLHPQGDGQSEAASEGEDLPEIKPDTLDISGGGVAFYHKSKIHLGTEYQVVLRLPGEEDELKVPAKVVRCEAKITDRRQRIFVVGLKFTGISDITRSLIIRHVFEIQKSLLHD